MGSSLKTNQVELQEITDKLKQSICYEDSSCIDGQLLIKQLIAGNLDVEESIFKRINLSPELLSLFYGLPDYWPRLLKCFDLPSEMLNKMYDSGDHALKWIMSQKKLSQEILDKFALDNNPDFIFNLAYNENNYAFFKELVKVKLDEFKKHDDIIKNSTILITYTDKMFGDCFHDFISDYSCDESGFKNITTIFGFDDNLLEICQKEQFDLVLSEYFTDKSTGELMASKIKTILPDLSSIICCGSHYYFACLKSISIIDHMCIFPFELGDLYSRMIWILGHKIQKV